MKKLVTVGLLLMMLCAWGGAGIADVEFNPDDYTTIDGYDDYARNPAKHSFEKIRFDGKVIQVIEESGYAQYRIAYKNDVNEVFLVEYMPEAGAPRILEDDTVTVYGVFTDLVSYESVLGGKVTIPSCIATLITEQEAFSASSSGNSVVGGNGQETAEQDGIAVTAYTWATTRYYYLGLVIENKGEKDVDVEVSILYRDANGSPVGTGQVTCDALNSGAQALLVSSNDLEFSSYDYYITTDDKLYYHPFLDDITYEANIAGNKAIVIATNNGESTIGYLKAIVLFLKDGIAVGYDTAYLTDINSELKPQSTQFCETSCSNSFNEIQVYFEGRSKK